MQLLKLRYLQLRRDLGYWIPLLALIAFYIAKTISETSQNYSIVLSCVLVFFLYNYHSNRKDLNFLNKYFTKPKRDICVNYNILVLPVSIAYVLCGYYLLALALHLAVTLLVFITIRTGGPRLVFINKFIPPSQFEWIAGVRKNFFILVPLLLLACVFSPVKFFGPLALFLLNTIFIGFYGEFEPLMMLNPENLNSNDFLRKKISFFTKLILIIYIPLLLINSILHPDVAWFNLCFTIGAILLGAFSIYTKYYDYKPNGNLSFRIDSVFVFATVLIPPLIPITLFLNHSYKKRALQNLTNYIDDNS